MIDNVGNADGFGGVAVGAGEVNEYGFAVVAQFGDRLADVREGAVVACFVWGIEIHLGVPAAGKLLDAGDINQAVMQILVNVGHVLCKKSAVNVHAGAGKLSLSFLGNVLLDVSEYVVLGIGQ